MLQAQVRDICVVPGPQTQVVPDRDPRGDARKWGLLGVYEPRLLIAPEGFWEGGWPSAHSPRCHGELDT